MKKAVTMTKARALAFLAVALAIGASMAGFAIAVSISSCGTISVNSELTTDLTSIAVGCFTIGADNVRLDCQGHVVDGNNVSSEYGVTNTGFDNVTVTGCRFTDWQIGVRFQTGANNGTIRNNTATAEGFAASASGASGYGVQIISSNNNTISINTLYGHGAMGTLGDEGSPGGDGGEGAGIRLTNSSGTKVINNVLSGNGGDGGGDGGAGSGSSGLGSGLITATSLSLNITGNNVSSGGANSGVGVYATDANMSVIEFNRANDAQMIFITTSNTTVRNSTATGSSGFINLQSSSVNSIIDNVVQLIILTVNSNLNVLTGNTVTSTGPVTLVSSNNNTLSNNILTANSTGIGISLSDAYNNTFSGNVVSSQNGTAVSLTRSWRAVFTNNRVSAVNGPGIQLSNVSYALFTGNNFSSGRSGALLLLASSQNNSFTNTTLSTNSSWLATNNSNLNNFTMTVFLRSNATLTIVPRVTAPAFVNVTLAKLNVSADRTSLNSTNLTFLNVSATIALNLSGQGVTDPFPTVDINDNGTFVTCSAELCTEQSFTNNLFTFNVSHFTGFSFGSTSGTLTNLTIFDETDSTTQYTGDTVEFFADYFNGSSGYDILGASCNASFGVDSTTQSMTYSAFIGSYKTTKLYGSPGTTDWNVTCAAAGFDTLTANDTVTIAAIGVPEFSTWTLFIALAGVLIGFFVIRARRGI
ncbi:right-handed parallel beta-helix repeat-containing protein [Candidatus Woesearchaeota archaeon]|nr:right-handed parallel beta-helix repeat-containing protein [Candidatus Woesearchaeota archaeon]